MKPLDGVLVLDLTRLLPGATATMMLLDSGAEVIKIEEPGKGDYARSMPPLIDGEGALFRFTNAGKKSVALDLKSERGRSAFLGLVERADIVVEGFRPGVMERLGLSFDVLSAANPKLIFASITGYPRDSERAREAGHDLNYMAAAGLLGWPPSMPTVQMADICGGSMMLVREVLLALIERGRTGKGKRIDVAMTEGLWPLAIAPRAFAAAGAVNPLTGAYPCYNLYETADGEWLAVGALEGQFWREFCAAADRREWTDRAFDPLLIEDVRAAMRERSGREWLAAFAGRDCCVNAVNRIEPGAIPAEPTPALG